MLAILPNIAPLAFAEAFKTFACCKRMVTCIVDIISPRAVDIFKALWFPQRKSSHRNEDTNYQEYHQYPSKNATHPRSCTHSPLQQRRYPVEGTSNSANQCHLPKGTQFKKPERGGLRETDMSRGVRQRLVIFHDSSFADYSQMLTYCLVYRLWYMIILHPVPMGTDHHFIR